MIRLALVVMALGLTGCSAVSVSTHSPSQQLELVGAFVYPFGFRWEEPAYRSFELSQRLVGSAIDVGGSTLSFWGPGEFKVMRADDDHAWVATTALPQLTATGARPDQAVIIRPWAEKRVNSSSQEASDARGRRAGASAMEETEYIGHIEVVFPPGAEIIVEGSASVKVDPFAEPSPDADYDPTPQLTALMDKLMRAAVKQVVRWSTSRTTQELPPVQFAATPAAALRFSDAARPSAELEMARMDAASLDLFLQARARFLNPSLDDAKAAKISKMLPGLVVLGPGPSGLGDGDLITTLDGQPAAPQVWARLRFSPQVPAKARKPTGEIVELLLP
ncbi:MAG: hypothetical protein JNK82_27945 [Myxococcaceae bacterium]|nr:hypothetical protein [Myxococcaceae bacterium]